MSDDRKLIAEKRDLLKGYCEHCPPAASIATVNAAVRFKEAVAKGKRLLKAPKTTAWALDQQIKVLHTFWGQS